MIKPYMMNYKKIMAMVAATFMAMSQICYAVPARPGKVVKTQPDGAELTVMMRGDERSHVVLSEDGYLLLPDAKGYYCYADIDGDGNVAPTAVVANNRLARTESEWQFVGKLNSDATLSRYAEQKRSAASRANLLGNPGLCPTTFSAFGEMHSLVILVEFADKEFSIEEPNAFFDRWCNEEGFDYNNATGSVRDYFVTQSFGQFQPTFDVYGPVKLDKKCSFYGANYAYGDDYVHEMILDACTLLDDEIDFTLYDFDEDGVVDNVYVIYAGLGENGEGGTETIWPHSSDLSWCSSSYDLKRDGKRLNHYACSAEIQNKRKDPDGIGTMVHEFSHVLGLPDLYDTEYAYAAYTPGNWSVLDVSCYNNNSHTPLGYGMFERYALGWVEPEVLDEPADITLRHVATGDGAMVKTASANEFFLFENRQQEGWDLYAPATGLLIWHIDYNSRNWNRNIVNNDDEHQGVDIEEADCDYGTVWEPTPEGDTFPGTTGKTEFSATTEPSMLTWKNVDLETPITEIAEKNGLVTFKVKGGASALGSVEAAKASVTCDGLVLRVADNGNNGFTVVDMAGRIVAAAHGEGEVILPSAGAYFVTINGVTTKILAR